jgi:hypothetical protein
MTPPGLPLAYFARQVTPVAEAESARVAMAELDPAQMTVLVGQGRSNILDPAAVVTVSGRAEDSLRLHYASKTPNLLRVAIPFYPGWKATLNGVELPLRTVDGAFIGVEVPPGEGDLALSYTPRWFALGATISTLALAAAVITLFLSGRRFFSYESKAWGIRMLSTQREISL